MNVWTDSKNAFGVLHAHGAIWKERGLLTAQGKNIKRAEVILKLLDAVQLPLAVAVMRCRGHQRGNSAQEQGNRLTDQEARMAAETGMTLSLIPKRKLPLPEQAKYNEKDLRLTEELKAKVDIKGWAILTDKRRVVPFSAL